MACSSITSALPCPGRLTSLGLSSDMKQFQNRNIFLVKLISSPQPLLFDSPVAFCSCRVFQHVNSRVNNLFFCLVGFFICFIPNWWKISSSGYGTSLDINQQETCALELPSQISNYHLISSISSAVQLLKWGKIVHLILSRKIVKQPYVRQPYHSHVEIFLTSAPDSFPPTSGTGWAAVGVPRVFPGSRGAQGTTTASGVWTVTPGSGSGLLSYQLQWLQRICIHLAEKTAKGEWMNVNEATPHPVFLYLRSSL